jgi:site-specific DNA-methyltransferase (adenine-specific)
MRKEVIGDATLWLGDCLEILPTLGKVDAVIADPPYGINYKTDSTPRMSRHAGKESRPVFGDDQPFNPAPFLGLAKKVVLWGASAYSERLPSNYGWLIWDKQIVGKWSGGDAETAWTNFLGSNRIFRHRWQGIQRAGEECPFTGGELDHPTQKPVALMRWCIEKAGNPALILDPYMGSGSTGVAATSMGLGFIGCEIDHGHFATACRRIEQAYKQRPLFDAEPPKAPQQLGLESA